jgi:hypothetical protein
MRGVIEGVSVRRRTAAGAAARAARATSGAVWMATRAARRAAAGRATGWPTARDAVARRAGEAVGAPSFSCVMQMLIFSFS